MTSLTRESLRDMAGHTSFDRGIDYLDRVSGLLHQGDSVRATVSGTRRYRVELRTGRRFSWDCTCPWAQEGNCCKHVVAVALVHLYEQEHGSTAPAVPDPEDYLRSLDREELLSALLAETDRSPALALDLQMRAAASAADLDALRVLLDGALRLTDTVPWEQAAEYARAVRGAADAVDLLASSGRVEEAMELTDLLHSLTDEAEDMVEDPDGEVVAALEHLRASGGF
ncbi:SWIM zinc finger family protein [Nocardiopsis lambiniae]|uniref:SWIM zinc finger family protein n=1 Tax=Nocardiopsis lambiniae TaxID=3075539 RepID=A0ABU2MBP8_9ACTN|nr:SWIM zinc finger family protein [Nocardiopsis sp. DSM 44743]MDT0330024.1 SWIM zinc finger family protein [Nocardiopsis sp. DSM 44743]